MKTHPLRHLTVALAAFGLALVALSGPAGATVVSGTVTSGTLNVTNSGGTGLQTIALGGGTSCGTSTLQADIDSNSIDLVNVSISGGFTFSGNPYIAVIEEDLGASYQGTVAGSTPASINDFGVGLSVDIYTQSATCVPGTLKCEDLTVTLNLDGSFSGNPASPASGNTATLTGSDAVALDSFSVCDAPFTSYLGGHVSITGAAPLVITL